MGRFSKWWLFFLLTFSISSVAQDTKYAREIVETLALPFFHGRGYVNSGDSLAAEFLAKEFKTVGLKPIGASYFQLFSFSVNTFPDKMMVKLNGKTLSTGHDYILDASSKGIKGKFKIVRLDSAVFSSSADPSIFFPTDKHKFAIAYPLEWKKRIAKLPQTYRMHLSQYPVVVELVAKKLTFSVAQEVDNQCTIQLLAEKFPAKTKRLQLEIENKFISQHTAKNVVGLIEGSSKKDSFLFVTAHYDHLGQLGRDIYFPGANDNASGVAMLLELAKYFTDSTHRLPYSLVFIGFAGEEAGLVGSKFYTENPVVPLSKIKFLLNLDLMGSGKEGLTVVNGSVYQKEFSLLDSTNKTMGWFPKIVARGKAANSDHYFFSEKGVPAFFLYTLGEITAYHDVNDTPEVVTFSKFKEAHALIVRFLQSFAF